MKIHARKSKGFTEIYFVLYLSALILLIPEKEDEVEINRSSNNNLTAFIKTERSSLSVKLQADTSGSKIISSDSVNIIYPVGDVKKVNYTFSILSQNIKRTIWSSDNDEIDENANFRIEKLNDNSVKFIWKPSNFNFTNQNYTVLAEADIDTKDTNNPFPIYSKTQFNLNMFYVDQVPVLASGEKGDFPDNQENQLDGQNTETQIIQTPPETLRAIPDEGTVRNLAYKTWTNDILVWGVDLKNELLGLPKITVSSDDPNADAEILDYTDSMLKLKGKTPGFGEMKVTVELTRKSDRKSTLTEFKVRPIPLKDPILSNTMYPEREYVIDPKLPQVNVQNEEAYIRSGKDVIAFLRDDQSTFRFIPQYSDIGKDIYFERLINNKPLESKIRIQVIDYPKPEYINSNQRGNEVVITFRAYGTLNGKKNYIKRLEFDSDKILFTDLSGETKEEDGSRIQVFRCRSKSGDLPSKFTVKAIDSKGRVSETRTLNF